MRGGIVTLGCRCLLAFVVSVLALAGCSGNDTPTRNQSVAVVSPAGVPEAKSQLVVESIQSVATQGTDCTLPEQFGLVDVFNVPRNDRIRAYIQFYGGAFGADATFSVQSENPDIVKTRSLKDDRSGEVILTVDKGSDLSSTFIIEGIDIDKTNLDIAEVVDIRDPKDPNDDITYPRHFTPVVVWAFEAEQIVDYNAMGVDRKICYDKQNSPKLKPDMASRTGCGGLKPDAVAADGASLQLLRVKAGGPGKVCFTFIVPPSATREAYYGKLSDPIAGGSSTNSPATNVSSIKYQAADDARPHHYAFATYTPPTDFFETSQTEREVEVEIQFIALNANGSPTRSHITAVKGKKIKIRRPPVLLVHGLWSSSDTWATSYKEPSPSGARLVESKFSYDGNLPYTQLLTRDVPNERLDLKIQKLISNARDGTDPNPEAAVTGVKIATTKVDVIAHSMGGLYTRQWIKSANYKKPENFNRGDINKLATVTTPHWGARLANSLINVHNRFFDPTTGPDGKLRKLEGRLSNLTNHGDIHQGAICELAENSSALRIPVSDNVRGRAYTASGGERDAWQLGIQYALGPLSDADRKSHTDPYIYSEENDGIVSALSQAANFPVGQSFSGYLHSPLGLLSWLLPQFFTVTKSSTVSENIFIDLDRPDGWAASLPSFSVSDSNVGIPITGGRGIDINGESIDASNFAAQCPPGAPLYQYSGQ